MELDIMWKSRIENKVLLRQMGAGLVDTKRVLINNGKIKSITAIAMLPQSVSYDADRTGRGSC